MIDGSACQEIGFSLLRRPLVPSILSINSPPPERQLPQTSQPTPPNSPSHFEQPTPSSNHSRLRKYCPVLRHLPSAPQTGFQFAHSAPSTSASQWHHVVCSSAVHNPAEPTASMSTSTSEQSWTCSGFSTRTSRPSLRALLPGLQAVHASNCRITRGRARYCTFFIESRGHGKWDRICPPAAAKRTRRGWLA